MFKKFLLSSLATAVIAGSAMAADLPSRKAPPVAYAPPAPMFTWTGFYIGANGGYFSGTRTNVVGSALFADPALGGAAVGAATSANLITSNGRRSDGGLAGGQVGFNWQVNSLVLGVEADLDGTFGRNNCGGGNCGVFSAPVPGFPGVVINSANSSNDRLSYIGTARGRIGFLALPNLLIYATGGAAFGRVSSSVSIFQNTTGAPATPFTSGVTVANATTRVGATAGGGLEWMFLPNWSLKVEGLYYDLGHVRSFSSFNSFSTALPTPFYTTGVATDTRARGVIARAGLNYHFGWTDAAPVVARY